MKITNDDNTSRDYVSLVPYEILDSAIEGNKNAIDEIVNHYGAYIAKFAKIDMHSRTTEKTYYTTDEDKSQSIKTAFVKGIKKFKNKYRT